MVEDNSLIIIDDVRNIFTEVDYFEFLKIINGNDEKIKKIDTRAIDNFDYSVSDLWDREYFVSLYQHIKFYLEQRDLYMSKMQEGIALCAAKAVIINKYGLSLINDYLTFGDNYNNSKCNPFEEITRILLIAFKRERNSNGFGENLFRKNYSDDEYESSLFLNVIMKAMNKDTLDQRARMFAKSHIIDNICEDLENSSISSTSPLNNRIDDNREVLNRQFERICSLYESKTNYRILLGDLYQDCDSISPVVDFKNKISYAKRNLGLTPKTKQLVK